MARSRRKNKPRAGIAPNVNLIDADLWQRHLNAKLTPAKQQAMERIIIAGMKVMFDKQTHKLMLTELDGPGDMVTKLAEATTKLMILLFKHSNGTMPPDLIIPAGGVLMAKACEFLNQSCETVTEDQFRQALTAMTKLIMKVAGAKDGVQAPTQAPIGAKPPAQQAASGGMLNQGV